MKNDTIKHPSHYVGGRKFEPKDVIRDWGLNFNLGNAVNYLARSERKGNPVEDLKKAQEYIQFEIDALEAERVHLCNTCGYGCIAGCPAEERDIAFGNGKGGDNIVKCKCYHKKGEAPKHPNCRCSVNPVFAELENGDGVSCGVIELEVPVGTPPEDIIRMAIEKIYRAEQ